MAAVVIFVFMQKHQPFIVLGVRVFAVGDAGSGYAAVIQ